MITNDYLRMLSRYNRWQNAELFGAAAKLTYADRRKDRGAFWQSIHGTFSHIYWGDRIWFSRFNVCEAPSVPQKHSASYVDDWSELTSMRFALDDVIVEWCDAYETGPISGQLKWFSGTIGREVEFPLAGVLPHIFNHQTHHRGQAHAMITAAGGVTSDTDMFIMPREHWPADIFS